MIARHRSDEAPQCLRGFEKISRYWDRRHNCFVAKILPGEFYVSRQAEMIATTLGSCVSACIWDSQAGIGGMNHFMLPNTEQAKDEVVWGNVASDATRYGNYAMEHLINELLTNGGLRRNLQAKIFGGGKVLKQRNDVGAKNVAFVIEYLELEKIPVVSRDLGDDYPRKVLFDPITGRAMMKKILNLHNDTIVARENIYKTSLAKKPTEGDIELF
jgi:chemotaxis protein CheD